MLEEKSIKMICQNCLNTFVQITRTEKKVGNEYINGNIQENYFIIPDIDSEILIELSKNPYYEKKSEIVFKIIFCLSCNKIEDEKYILGKYILSSSKKNTKIRKCILIEKKKIFFRKEKLFFQNQNNIELKRNYKEEFETMVDMSKDLVNQVIRINESKIKFFNITKRLTKNLIKKKKFDKRFVLK